MWLGESLEAAFFAISSFKLSDLRGPAVNNSFRSRTLTARLRAAEAPTHHDDVDLLELSL